MKGGRRGGDGKDEVERRMEGRCLKSFSKWEVSGSERNEKVQIKRKHLRSKYYPRGCNIY
jgi:hypothetical protein